jgi:hypothetical protein
MIETIIGILGGVVLLSGAGTFVYALLQNKGKQVVQGIDSLTKINLSELLQQSKPSNRIEALEHCDALMTFFEQTESAEGQKAMQEVAGLIFKSNGAK